MLNVEKFPQPEQKTLVVVTVHAPPSSLLEVRRTLAKPAPWCAALTRTFAAAQGDTSARFAVAVEAADARAVGEQNGAR